MNSMSGEDKENGGARQNMEERPVRNDATVREAMLQFNRVVSMLNFPAETNTVLEELNSYKERVASLTAQLQSLTEQVKEQKAEITTLEKAEAKAIFERRVC